MNDSHNEWISSRGPASTESRPSGVDVTVHCGQCVNHSVIPEEAGPVKWGACVVLIFVSGFSAGLWARW